MSQLTTSVRDAVITATIRRLLLDLEQSLQQTRQASEAPYVGDEKQHLDRDTRWGEKPGKRISSEASLLQDLPGSGSGSTGKSRASFSNLELAWLVIDWCQPRETKQPLWTLKWRKRDLEQPSKFLAFRPRVKSAHAGVKSCWSRDAAGTVSQTPFGKTTPANVHERSSNSAALLAHSRMQSPTLNQVGC